MREAHAIVDSVKECAERLLYLLRNPEEGADLARAGREIVTERFLLTRLISEELELYAAVLDAGRGAHPFERAR